MSIMLQLRTAALSETNVLHRKNMRDCADNISKALGLLQQMPENEVMRELNCWWARGMRLLDLHTPVGDDGGGGTGLRETRLAA